MTTTTLKPVLPASVTVGGTTDSLLACTIHRIGQWHARARQRRHLAELSPRLLDDLGLDVQEARNEAAKPFWRA